MIYHEILRITIVRMTGGERHDLKP